MKKQRNLYYLQKKLLSTFDEVINFFTNKYYNIFMNKIEIGGVDYQQKDYILKKFWSVGTLSGFLMQGTKGSTDNPEGLPVFCEYAPCEYNLYDWPIKATLINTRGVSFIPSTLQEIDKDIVIGFAQRTKKPVKFIVEYYAKKIGLCEIVIQTQLLAKKMPYLIGTSPENKTKMEELVQNLFDDNPVLYLDAEDINNLKVLLTGGNYEIDKLKNLQKDYENELRECLGLDNLGVGEKKEHLINQEIEANDEITEDSGSIVIDCLKEFGNQFKKVFNYNLTFTWKESQRIEKQEAQNDYIEEDQI